MNRQASFMKVFQLLKEGYSLDEIRASYASPDGKTIENIASSLDYIDALPEKSAISDLRLEVTEETNARKAFREWLLAENPSVPEAGQIWTVDVPDDPQLRLITLLDVPEESSANTISVAPVSIEVDFASDRDLILDAEESPLGYDFMVEAWHYGTIASDRLVEYQGVLSDRLTTFLLVLHSHCLTHEPLEDLCSVVGVDYSDVTVRLGEPLVEEDVRNDFRSRESRIYLPLWRTGVASVLVQEQSVMETEAANEPTLTKVAAEWIEHIRGIVFKPVSASSLSLAASTETKANTARFQGEFQGFENLLELTYSRHSGDLYMQFLKMSDELAHRFVTIKICRRGSELCDPISIKMPGNLEERLTLASKGKMKVEDVTHLELALEA